MTSKRADDKEPPSYQALLDENHSLQSELKSLKACLKEATGLMHAEEELRESEDKYRAFFENSSDAILLALVNGTVYKANPAACRIFGMTEEEIIQTGRNGLLDTLDPRLELALEEVGRTGRFKGELNHRRKDGTIFPGEIWTEIFKDKNGSLKVFIIIRDITEHKLKEDTLRKTEERYRTLLINMTDCFILAEIISNKNGRPYNYRFLEVNPAFELNTGIKREEILGKTVLEVFPNANRKILEKCLEIDLTNKSKYFEFFSQTLRKHLDVYVLSHETGKIAVIFRDITERKQLEEKTRQRAEEIETVMEIAPTAIWIAHDSQSHNITGNRMANELYEAKTGENVSANITPVRRFFQNGHELAADELPMQKATQKGIDVRNEEIDILLPCGKWKAILGSASPLHDINGNVRGGVAAFMDITQRKKAEAKLKETLDNLEELVKQRTEELEKAYNSLKESERGLAQAQTMTHIGSWEWNLLTDKIYWSAEMYRIFGLKPQEFDISFDKVLNYIHPDDRDHLINAYKESLKGKKPSDLIEYRIVSADGEKHVIHGLSEVIFDEDNNPVRLRGINQDITERKQHEEALRKSEERFRAFVTASSEVIYRMSPDWRVMNRLCGRGFLADTENLNPTWLQEYILLEDQPHVTAVINEAIRTKSMFKLEHRVRQEDGSIGWTYSRAVPILDENSEIAEWFGAAIDITNRKKAEDALRKSKEQYQTLFNFISEGFANYKAIYDEKGIICDLLLLDINPAGARLLGIEREIGKTVRELLPGIKDNWFEAFNRVDQTGESIQFESFGNVTGKWYVAQIDRIEKGQFAVVFRDITEKKMAQEALAKMETARKKEIHHRIKNNLQVISSLLDLAAEKFNNRQLIESKEVLEAFEESQNRVMSIAFIHKELHEGGELEKLNFSLYLEKLAENLFQTYRVGHSGISLDLDLENNLFFDMDTAVPLGMIVNELISNSFKYAFPGRDKGTIRIKLFSEGVTNEPNSKEELKRKDTKYTLIISDNGIGIPDNIDLENIDTLGLQLVSILVDQLDGEIKVGRDQGTEFNICFNTHDNED
jgi:PAS domain S-box-containing protein